MRCRICGLLRLLHFRSPDEETDFLRQHQRWLPHQVMFVQAVGMLCYAVAFVQQFQWEMDDPDSPFRWQPQDARFPTLAFYVVIVLLRVFTISYIVVSSRCSSERATLVAERSMIALSMFNCIVGPLMNGWRGPSLLGADPRITWKSNREIEGAEAASLAVVFCHLAITSAMSIRCSTLWVHHVIVAVSNLVIRSFHSPFPYTNRWVHTVTIIVTCCSLICAYRIELFTRQSWTNMRISQTAAEGRQVELERQQVELEKQQATTDAMRSVLHVSFDVVFQTCEAFVLKGDNSHVRAILGGVRSSVSAEVRLHDLLTPADCERLDSLARDATTLGVPQLMATASTDSNSEHIPQVEILVADTKMGAEHKYLIGLRIPPMPLDNKTDRLPTDYRDEARLKRAHELEVQACDQDREPRNVQKAGQLAVSTTRTEMDVYSIPSVDTNASGSWAPLEMPGGAPKEDEIYAVVDALSSTCGIYNCSPLFAEIFQPAYGQGLAGWAAEAYNFSAWVQHQINLRSNVVEDAAGNETSMHVTLQPPSAAANGVEFRVCVKIAPATVGDTPNHMMHPAGNAPDESVLVKLFFQRVRWRRLRGTRPMPLPLAL